MTVLTKYDFIALDYVGRVTDTDNVFDVTRKEDAEQYGLFHEQATYIPRIVGVGMSSLVAGLDTALPGKEVGKTYTVAVPSSLAFGPRNAKLLQLVPTKVLLAQKIRPMVGLQIFAAGRFGTIRSVAGGRTTVDFNHPLAGKDLTYTFTIVRLVTDVSEKVAALLDHGLHLRPEDYILDHKEKTVTITPKKKIPASVQNNFLQICTEVLKDVTVTFAA